jgi:hypothetical protein
MMIFIYEILVNSQKMCEADDKDKSNRNAGMQISDYSRDYGKNF